jgi:hypothetical protein
MNLLFRLINFLIRLTFTILIRLLIILFRLILPHILATLRLLRTLMFMSITATVNGPRQFIDRLASEWTRHFLDRGVPRDYINQIYSLCHFLAGSAIVLGWMVTALFTYAILRVVFGLFT